MDVTSPFALTAVPLSVQVKPGRWFPVAVTLSNSGDAVSGHLTLRLTSSSGLDDTGRHIVAVSDVDLPPTSRKRIWLYSRLDHSQIDGAVVSFVGRGFKPLTVPMALKINEPGHRIVVTVSDAGERFAFLASLTDKRLANRVALAAAAEDEANGTSNSAAVRWVRPLAASHDQVPDRWAGLEAADIVVLGDFPHRALTAEQSAALKGYVAAGGALLVPAGQDWQRLAQSALAPMWPITPLASTAATQPETAALVQRYLGGGGHAGHLSGADRLGGSPAVLTRGPLLSGAHLLAGSRQAPLLAERDWGAGQVIWMAMDTSRPPFVGWRGQSALWVELLGQTHQPRRLEPVSSVQIEGNVGFNPNSFMGFNPNLDAARQTHSVTAAFESVVHSLPELRMPPLAVIVWFLIVYIVVLVPVNYFVLWRLDKREWAWFTVPIIALCFSVVSYGAARSIKGTALLARHINIVQAGGGAKLARADAMLWILTPRHASYEVSSPDTQMVLSHTCPENAAEGACNDDTTIREGDPARSLRLEDVDVPMWEQAEFIGQSVLGMGQGIALGGTPGSSGATVHNGTPFALRGAVIVDGQRVYRCGKIGAIDAGAGAPLLELTAAEQKQLSEQVAADPANQVAGVPAPDSSVSSAKWRRGRSGRKYSTSSARAFNEAVHAQRTLYAKLIYACHIKELFAPQAGSAAGDETSQHLARTVLSQMMAGQFATTPGSPVLVAWGAAPATPLILEDETPQQQNVTLFLVHLAP